MRGVGERGPGHIRSDLQIRCKLDYWTSLSTFSEDLLAKFRWTAQAGFSRFQSSKLFGGPLGPPWPRPQARRGFSRPLVVPTGSI